MCYDEWESIEASPTVIDWIKNGVELPFRNEPLPFEYRNRHFNKKEQSFLQSEIARLLEIGVIERDNNLCHISPINCVPKRNNKFRLVADLRHINSHINSKNFKYDNILSITENIKPDDRLVTVDIKDGFYHIPVSKQSQECLAFAFEGQKYKWCRLPFGCCVSPYFFCKTLKPIITYLRSKGIRVSVYVDDFILAATVEEIENHKNILLETLLKLGIVVNFEKSSLDPSTCKEYIGYIISTQNDDGLIWIKIPQKRITKLRHDIRLALKKKVLSARSLARISGQCIAMSKAIIPAKLLLRNIYKVLRKRTSWQDKLELDTGCIKDLTWWLNGLKSWNGCAIHHKPIDFQLVTDASHIGWGGVLGDKQAQGLWTPQISSQCSNYREMMAVYYAMKALKTDIAGKVIQVLSDNISTVANINFQGGQSQQLTDVATLIWSEALGNNVTLTAKYLAGYLNYEADYLSRRITNTDWMLNPAVFKYLDRLWGPHTIDRCASMNNRQVSHYNSMFYDPETSGVDCLAQQDWGVHNNFINPPFCLIPRILAVLRKQQATGTLIAPMWKSKSWYQALVKMTIFPPIRIPHSHRAFISLGRSVIPEPLKNSRWKIFAWRISGSIQ